VSSYPTVHVFFAPDAKGVQQPVNAIVSLRTAEPSICLRADGSDPKSAYGALEPNSEDVVAARAALKNALRSK
jgi:hypothetical protein